MFNPWDAVLSKKSLHSIYFEIWPFWRKYDSIYLHSLYRQQTVASCIIQILFFCLSNLRIKQNSDFNSQSAVNYQEKNYFISLHFYKQPKKFDWSTFWWRYSEPQVNYVHTRCQTWKQIRLSHSPSEEMRQMTLPPQ